MFDCLVTLICICSADKKFVNYPLNDQVMYPKDSAFNHVMFTSQSAHFSCYLQNKLMRWSVLLNAFFLINFVLFEQKFNVRQSSANLLGKSIGTCQFTTFLTRDVEEN